MVAVLADHCDQPLAEQSLLNVGGSAGIIDSHLAENFRAVTSIDIDENANNFAKDQFESPNLEFKVGMQWISTRKKVPTML